MRPIHTSVLLNETIASLNIRPDGIYIDGTLGGGGHALEILSRLNDRGRLIGIDQDRQAIERCRERLRPWTDQIYFVHDNFANIDHIAKDLGLTQVHGVLLDLGVSSFQLDEGARGFSYAHDAPLDMRMDQTRELSAAEVVNTYEESRLYRIIRDYGEERYASSIASKIVRRRTEKPIETTGELTEIIRAAMPGKALRNGPHPARRTFQAIRIEVNAELSILEKAVTQYVNLLCPDGRISVITFHSLEDRIIKNTFRNLVNPCNCPKELPVCVCGKKPILELITRKPVQPGPEELEINHRARSARLRCARRI